MAVLNTNGFRPAVSELRSLNGEEGVGFHTLTNPEDRSVRLLVKTLGWVMPESIVRWTWNPWTFVYWESRSYVTAVKIRNPRTAFSTPLQSIVGACGVPRAFNIRTLRTAGVDGDVHGIKKTHYNTRFARALDTRSLIADTRRGASYVGVPTNRLALYPTRVAPCCDCG